MSSTEHQGDVVPLEDERRRRQHAAGEIDPSDAMGTAGAMLTAARTARGLSLDEVAEQTNIPVPKLVALEAMAIDQLPAAPFTLGFVRTYGLLLNLPADALVARYRDEAGMGRTSRRAAVAAPDSDLSPPTQASLFAVVVVFCVLAYVVWQILQAVSGDETIEPPAQFPLSMTEDVATPVSYESSTTLEADPTVAPNEAAETPSDDAAVAELPAELPADDPAESDDGLTEIERLQLSIEPQIPMIAVAPPESLPRVKPTTDQRREQAEARRRAALAAAAAAAEALREQEALEASQAQAAEADAAAEDAVAASAQVTEPVRLLAVQPVYPTRCEADAAASEAVTVTYRVSRFGKVQSPEVSSTTNDCFNRAALAAVARWNFDPAMEDGRAVLSGQQSTRIRFERP